MTRDPITGTKTNRVHVVIQNNTDMTAEEREGGREREGGGGGREGEREGEREGGRERGREGGLFFSDS